MHKLFLFLLFGIYTLAAAAVPAKRVRQTLTLADGSKVEATMMGNETLHFYKTDDGRCLQCDSLGIAHFIDSDILYNRWKANVGRRHVTKPSRKGISGRKQGARAPMTGSKLGLVILVQFPESSFHYTDSTFQRYFNEEGYTDDVNVGSVHDYFIDASYGQFDFTFDVIGPITMSKPLSYYGNNDSYGYDLYPATMVTEAVNKIDSLVDFSRYDWDGDGEVEQLFVIHSGYDEAQGGKRTDIWSHAYTLSEAEEFGDGNGPVAADGVLIDRYATSSELRGNSGTRIAGIGTACHEFSHCFSLPDFYDTEGHNFGMNSWDIMDYGCYNGNGGRPAGFTSYERAFCGWLTPIELTEPIAVQNMPPLTSEPVAYILRNSGKEDEYYLLENRQQESWDSDLSGHGMLILHVDYDQEAWALQAVNTERFHQRMTIIPADNILYSSTLAGDPWPGTSNNTVLSDTSTPAATLYNKSAEGDKLMHHSFTEISESADGRISFNFDDKASKTPSIISTKGEESVYDLQGRKINSLHFTGNYRGVCIRNGKKLLIQ